MTDEILVDGMIFHGPGGCPKCGMPLIAADVETTIFELNTDGNIINDETSIEVGGICSKCGHRVPMVRWQGGYIPYSPTSYALKVLEANDKILERVTKLNSDAAYNNPIAIIAE